MSDKMREALEEIVDILADAHGYDFCQPSDEERCQVYGGTGEACFACRCHEIAYNSLSTPDTYRVPDETTPDDAAVWVRVAWTGDPLGDWNVRLWGAVKDYLATGMVVLAKENCGQPPEDWRPE